MLFLLLCIFKNEQVHFDYTILTYINISDLLTCSACFVIFSKQNCSCALYANLQTYFYCQYLC